MRVLWRGLPVRGHRAESRPARLRSQRRGDGACDGVLCRRRRRRDLPGGVCGNLPQGEAHGTGGASRQHDAGPRRAASARARARRLGRVPTNRRRQVHRPARIRRPRAHTQVRVPLPCRALAHEVLAAPLAALRRRGSERACRVRAGRPARQGHHQHRCARRRSPRQRRFRQARATQPLPAAAARPLGRRDRRGDQRASARGQARPHPDDLWDEPPKRHLSEVPEAAV
mmetsp:Transcript_38501/g.124318  ORF Transcript_38501/g.124318 Transcript_38501/m.124318 type:complete len:228 (-) Transcript_38501:204-887(-)